ncbi:MAG: hypothetical protein ACP5SH_01945 [Syntrophobacteraceae bacterium]
MVRRRGAFASFRKQAKKVEAFPSVRATPVQGWRPKLGERVQTPNGVGTVVKVSGEIYLVDLDDQIANVWERLRSIKRLG